MKRVETTNQAAICCEIKCNFLSSPAQRHHSNSSKSPNVQREGAASILISTLGYPSSYYTKLEAIDSNGELFNFILIIVGKLTDRTGMDHEQANNGNRRINSSIINSTSSSSSSNQFTQPNSAKNNIAFRISRFSSTSSSATGSSSDSYSSNSDPLDYFVKQNRIGKLPSSSSFKSRADWEC